MVRAFERIVESDSISRLSANSFGGFTPFCGDRGPRAQRERFSG